MKCFKAGESYIWLKRSGNKEIITAINESTFTGISILLGGIYREMRFRTLTKLEKLFYV